MTKKEKAWNKSKWGIETENSKQDVWYNGYDVGYQACADKVCSYVNLHRPTDTVYKTQCGHESLAILPSATHKYCHYCGGKIKDIEAMEDRGWTKEKPRQKK